MDTISITARNSPRIIRDVSFVGDAKTYELDFSAWAEDNHAVTSATWTVKAGSASVSGQSLTSNVATALITTEDSGGSLIEIKAETGTETCMVYIDFLTKDPNISGSDAYGLVL